MIDLIKNYPRVFLFEAGRCRHPHTAYVGAFQQRSPRRRPRLGDFQAAGSHTVTTRPIYPHEPENAIHIRRRLWVNRNDRRNGND